MVHVRVYAVHGREVAMCIFEAITALGVTALAVRAFWLSLAWSDFYRKLPKPHGIYEIMGLRVGHDGSGQTIEQQFARWDGKTWTSTRTDIPIHGQDLVRYWRLPRNKYFAWLPDIWS